MNKLALIILLLFIPSVCCAIDFSQTDKQNHAVYSALGAQLGYRFIEAKKPEWSKTQKTVLTFVVIMAGGAIKESFDADFSWEDMGANATGAITSLLFTYRF